MMWFIALGIAVVIVAWYRPTWALSLSIVAAPAYLLKSSIGGVPVTALEMVVVGCSVGWFIRQLVTHSLQHSIRTLTAIPTSLWVSIIIVAVGWLIACYFSIDRRASFGALKAYLVEPAFLGCIAYLELQVYEHRRLIVRALLVSLSWVSLAGIVQMVWFRSTLQDGRLSSIFAPVANYFAMFAAPLIIVAIGLLLTKIERVWAAIAAGVGIIALFLSFSYGGFLAAGVGTIILFFGMIPAARRTRVIVLFVSAGLVLFAVLIPSKHFQEKLNFTTRSSSSVRVQIWRTALAIGVEHPFVGIGPNTFEKEYRSIAPTLYHPPLEWLVAKPHNLYLNAWIETGALATVGMVWFFALFLWMTMRRTAASSPFAWIAAASVIGILAHGLVDTPLFKNDLAVLAAVIIALGIASIPTREHHR